MNEGIKIDAEDLNRLLNGVAVVASVLKRRFPNLTVNETNVIAKEIIQSFMAVTK